MSVWNEWKASCDTCRRPFSAGYYSQAIVLESMRKHGWKYRRTAIGESGFTKLVVTCPECAKKPAAHPTT